MNLSLDFTVNVFIERKVNNKFWPKKITTQKTVNQAKIIKVKTSKQLQGYQIIKTHLIVGVTWSSNMKN